MDNFEKGFYFVVGIILGLAGAIVFMAFMFYK
jgi:uncharacterized membrane protein